jgi:hypothetical protein
MKKALIVFISLLSIQAFCQLPVYKQHAEIQIEFNHNIEFAGLVFFMGSMAADASAPGARMTEGMLKKDWFAYDLSLCKRYEAHQKDTNLQIAAGFLEQLQATDIFPLLLNVAPFPKAKVHRGIHYGMIRGFAPGKDSLAAAKQAGLFLSALNHFYQTLSFDSYYKTAKPLYKKAMAEIKAALPASGSMPVMESFYGKKFAAYILLPSLTIPSGMAFGVKSSTAVGVKVYNVFGPFAKQHFDNKDSIDLGYNDPKHILELSVHEFGHSFANPVVDLLPDSLIQSRAHLFPPIQTAMDNQGYQTWKSCVTEHFVRAGEVIIARKAGRKTAADDLLKHYVEKRKFIYLPDLIPVLEAETKNSSSVTAYHEAVIKAFQSLPR